MSKKKPIETVEDMKGMDVFTCAEADDSTSHAGEFESRFEKLVARWKEDSLLMSSPVDMAALPSYLQIIGMGKPAVPLLLRELQREPNHWFWALSTITGENPIPPESAGNVKEMATAWLKWGKSNGHV